MAQEIFPIADDLPEADRRVLTVIRKTLLDYEPLRATRPVLEVTVHAGLVHMRGRVRTSAIKEIAELLVHQLEPVRAVRNDLIADPEVVRAVADALSVDPEIGPACPVVDCRDGVVIMVGEVPTDDAARRAIELATAVPLVASVTSHLRAIPPVSVPAHSTNGSSNGAVAVASQDNEAVP
jgi:osmotically-inducible protein OsmY